MSNLKTLAVGINFYIERPFAWKKSNLLIHTYSYMERGPSNMSFSIDVSSTLDKGQ